MSGENVFVALQSFCEGDDQPRQELLRAGLRLQENRLGRRLHREDLPALLGEADAVLAGIEPYDAETLERLPRLRCISRCGTGTDSIDLEMARKRGVAVLTTPEEVVEPVAQMALGMLLALARNFPLHLDDFRRGEWKKHTGHLLSEWAVGIAGFGRVGKAFYEYLRPFGCTVRVYDPNLPAQRFPPQSRCADLESLLRESDVLSLHAALPPDAPPLLGRREFALMRKGSRLINTARGRLVDEAALIEALESGHLSGAALDVYESEPYTAGKLCQLPQVLCTPHVASLTARSRGEMELRCARNVIQFFSARGGRG